MCRQEINVGIDDDNDEQTIHMYNNGREEESYRSQDVTRNYESHYDDSDFSSVGWIVLMMVFFIIIAAGSSVWKEKLDKLL